MAIVISSKAPLESQTGHQLIHENTKNLSYGLCYKLLLSLFRSITKYREDYSFAIMSMQDDRLQFKEMQPKICKIPDSSVSLSLDYAQLDTTSIKV